MKELLLILYFLIVIIIGFISYKKISGYKDFFIAGKQAGVFQVSGSLLATVLGSSAILGSVDFAYQAGWAGSWLMLTASLGLLILYPFLKYISKFQGYNLPEMLGEFYGEEVKKISSFIIPIAWLGIVASQIMGAAKIVSILTHYTYNQGIWISGGVFILYTVLGGQLSIIKTDFIQLIFILLGIIVVFSFTIFDGGNSYSQGFFNSHFSSLDLFIMILTYSTTYLVGPDIYSRLFCAKDYRVMQKSILLAVSILIPLAFILAWLGIYGNNQFLQLDDNSVLLMIAELKLPKIIAGILYFGLLSAVISSADTTLLTASSLFTQVLCKDLKSKKAMEMTRGFIFIFGIIAIIIALKMKHILATLLLALAVYSGAFIVPTLVGMFGYRGQKKLIILAILCGGGLALLGKIYGGDRGNYILILSFLLNGALLLLGKKRD